jgi:NAD(P)-dependent dehydrogenase (short-subunit alcohol dehydrogenase family)
MEGAYCASKFAIEGIADVLRVELRQWHIQVSVVEPGPTDTGSRRCSTTWSRVCRPATASSTRPTSAASSSLSAPCSPGTVPPDVVARVVEEGLTARRPRARYAAGVQARAMVTMNAVLPTRLNDAIGGRLIGLR